jgi:hypothetical protein
MIISYFLIDEAEIPPASYSLFGSANSPVLHSQPNLMNLDFRLSLRPQNP